MGCEKEKSLTYSSSLIGEWSWFRTCGGFVGCVTPEVEHTTIRLIFTSDSTYSILQNDSLILLKKFHTYKLISSEGKDTSNVLYYDSTIQVYSIYNDTLFMSDLGNIFSSGYKRLK
jgi:hypothetical protein